MADSVHRRGMSSPGHGQPKVEGQLMSRRATLQRVHIDDLPAEVLGKVVSHLEDKERCDVVPLVSKYWHYVHKNYPPKRKRWGICRFWPVTQPMVRWFVSIAGNLKVLSVYSVNPKKPCCLPQMLALAATSAPKLRELTIHHLGVGQPIMHSLALLPQLTRLHLAELSFPANGDVSGIACISGLQSLKVMIFDRVDLPAAATPVDYGPGYQADELWGALSHLKHLTQLCIDNWEYPNDNEEEYDEDFLEDSRAPFFGKVSLVTQLRSLKLRVRRECLVEHLYYPDSFSKLTQLTAFESRNRHPSTAIIPFLGLPQLQRLNVHMGKISHLPGEFVVQSEHLTYMEISAGDYYLPVTDMLPTCASALSRLRVLKLKHGGLKDFPRSVACGLRHLCELNLRCNSLESVPSALRHIATLTKLDLSKNKALQLGGDDHAILESLSDLQRLNLRKSGKFEDVWSDTSVHVMGCILMMQVSCKLKI